MGSISESPLRVAVLINTDEREYADIWRRNYTEIFASIDNKSQLEFYEPAIRNEYPDPKAYDLVVLGGGSYIPDDNCPWITNLVDFIKNMIEKYPTQKVVGICLGHQKTGDLLGSNLVYLPEAELGVHEIKLTDQGKKFFDFASSTGTVNLHEFHLRYIDHPPPGFITLAEDNQILLSEANTILTFQGHPELSAELAVKMLSNDSDYIRGKTAEQTNQIMQLARKPHDGREIWKRIVRWVRE